jgi:hypothetical protein
MWDKQLVWLGNSPPSGGFAGLVPKISAKKMNASFAN